MIETQDDARRIAERYVAEVMAVQLGEPIVVTAVSEYPTCWVVGYATKAFIETGDFSHQLAGGPIIINRRTGILRMGVSAAPTEEQLDPPTSDPAT